MKPNRYNDATRTRYATADDFINIFNEEMRSIFLLCLLLTADMDKAERCFIDGLDQCMREACSFLEWGRRWARRIVIKEAIQLIMPSHQPSIRPASGCLSGSAAHGMDSALCSLLELETIERFVVVISLIERYSDQDCALLLGCRRTDVAVTRAMALRKLSRRTVGASPTEDVNNSWRSIWLGRRIRATAPTL